jgi:D-alanyl-lipoteichoic acid acyltransferase DltB (MBOAT superfamily)
MKVPSLLFFAASFLAALVFHRLPRKWANGWLLILSIGFIATWSWQFVLLLVLFSIVNFSLAQQVEKHSSHAAQWSTGGIVFNVAFLFLLKYNQFYMPAFSRWLANLGIASTNGITPFIVPIGISFLAVQAISTLLDIKNKRVAAEKDFVRFSTYLLYFPKLLSGPIERMRLFLPRLENPKPLDRALFERSLALLLIGLFRKIVIADPLFNMIPANAFVQPLQYQGQHLVFWLLAYSFALYNDFVGYTNIIRGVSLWFGIELTNNFNLPYLAHNFTEFWNRWHISLSQWLRDYIFFPTARSLMKRFSPRTHWINIVIPPMITMLVSGAWHGLAWNLLMWGGLHGIFQIVERLWSLRKNARPVEEQPGWRKNLGTVFTFSLAALAWVPFRMPVNIAIQYWQGLFRWTMPDIYSFRLMLVGKLPEQTWASLEIPNPLLVGVLVIAIIFDIQQSRSKREEFILDWPRLQVILLVVVLLFTTLLSVLSDQVAPFVYQGF